MKISIFIKTTAILATTVLCISAAQAATSGTPGVGGADAFNSVWTTVKSWTQGTLGKVMALVMILVGIAAGIARQSLMGFVVGAGSGIGLYSAPLVIESIMGASLPVDTLVNVAQYGFWL